jgi:hypothetical protein
VGSLAAVEVTLEHRVAEQVAYCLSARRKSHRICGQLEPPHCISDISYRISFLKIIKTTS